MATPRNGSDLKFSSPANYRICVKGYLDDSWSDRLVGMTIANQVSQAESPVSTLCGAVRDQTELLGLLNSIYEMHLPLLSIELLNAEENNECQ